MSAKDYGQSEIIHFPQFFTTDKDLRRGRRTLYPVVFKRALDLGLALLILPPILPVLVVLWIIAKLDGGPGFFGHRRIGQHGKTFRCWKIRTMVPDAETRLAAHLQNNPAAAAEWDRDCKLTNDPRITKIGAFLRATSLDELPQIWNVIKGDMSFVGPRPVVRHEMEKYGQYRSTYMSVRPGITGVWQISGRNDIDYSDRVRMDTHYVHTASLLLDLEIIAKTTRSVFLQTGK